MKEIKLKAFAKINLNLKIAGKLKNGYHKLDSVFTSVDLADLINVCVYQDKELASHERDKYQKRILITSSSNDMPKDKSNIVYKMVDFLRRKEKFSHYVRIFIRKNIPVGAGLGGGSTDAAAVYLALKKLLRLKDRSNINNILAKKVGADVPFFLKGGIARVGGMGEKIKKISPAKKVWIVLVNPRYKISTKWAYKEYDKINKKQQHKKSARIQLFKNLFYNQKLLKSGNDLESVVFKKYPKLKKIKGALIDKGAYISLLSGSGPTIFGLFISKEKARKAVLYFRRKGFWVKLTRPTDKAIAIRTRY